MLIDVDQSHRVFSALLHQFQVERLKTFDASKCCTIWFLTRKNANKLWKIHRENCVWNDDSRGFERRQNIKTAWNVSRAHHIWNLYLLHCYFKLELLTQPRNWVLLLFFFMVMMFTHFCVFSSTLNWKSIRLRGKLECVCQAKRFFGCSRIDLNKAQNLFGK